MSSSHVNIQKSFKADTAEDFINVPKSIHHEHSKTSHCVELLCHKGCKAVWGVIKQLEAGKPLPETRGLSPQENAVVLEELKSIMSVYEKTGSCSID
jgi:hypothetical protein